MNQMYKTDTEARGRHADNDLRNRQTKTNESNT